MDKTDCDGWSGFYWMGELLASGLGKARICHLYGSRVTSAVLLAVSFLFGICYWWKTSERSNDLLGFPVTRHSALLTIVNSLPAFELKGLRLSGTSS